MVRMLTYLLVFHIFGSIRTFGLQTPMVPNENTALPKLVNILKINNDHVFDNTPDLTILKTGEFVFTINNTCVFNKQKYNSLYQKVKSCKKYMSKNSEIINTFRIYPNDQYISSNTLCKFKFKFTSKPIKLTVDSKYIYDTNFEVIQHNIENIEINNRKINALDILTDYLNSTNKESIIGFLTFIFMKR